ncbi:hypothetical protein JCM21900_002844 [Sporobolomyces salmonicolor]
MASSSSATTYSDKRLYVGNLSATVDEYSLMQLCAKHGKIAKLDYLFHKTGPMKGKPRGYAFVEYGTKEEAQRAKTALQDRLLRGRKLVVSLASEQNPADQAATGGTKKFRAPAPSDLHRPTPISLLKGQGVANAPTNRKIAALEAKLAAMQRGKESPSPAPSSRSSTPVASTSRTLASEDKAGEWLDAVLPEGGAATPTNAQKGEEEDRSRPASRSAGTTSGIDRAKAGLPARPYFETSGPPREM